MLRNEGGGKWVTQRSGAFIEDGWTAYIGRAHYKIIRLEVN